MVGKYCRKRFLGYFSALKKYPVGHIGFLYSIPFIRLLHFAMVCLYTVFCLTLDDEKTLLRPPGPHLHTSDVSSATGPGGVK